ncbi:MAG: type I-E CRISPR-associated protein Cas6/Cse3/CasE [Firmicutes bacterium]|jgi:CRISPR system Cascade subunit CasE|nr:type I-E CRISPR-associated protein Cas6/Cse3/CasE [Bacillota bacterium]
MYLSRLILDARSREVRRDLSDCHDMHRTLLRAFGEARGPDGGSRNSFGILYRLETDRQTGCPKVYVQSAERPDWTRLPSGYLMGDCDVENPACKELSRAYAQLHTGMVLAFALRANPTRKTGTASKAERLAGTRGNGHRVFITRPDEQIAWLRRKGEESGYELMSVRVDTNVPDVDTRPEPRVYGQRGEAKLTYGSVFFEGHLRITNEDKFRTTLTRGIGSGKAYGFGLLTVAPPR